LLLPGIESIRSFIAAVLAIVPVVELRACEYVPVRNSSLGIVVTVKLSPPAVILAPVSITEVGVNATPVPLAIFVPPTATLLKSLKV